MIIGGCRLNVPKGTLATSAATRIGRQPFRGRAMISGGQRPERSVGDMADVLKGPFATLNVSSGPFGTSGMSSTDRLRHQAW
jgi:hypothetical protein